MANEVEELRRYMRGCLGRTLLPKTRAPRLFEFAEIQGNAPNRAVIPDDALVTLSVFTSKDNWATKNMPYKQFKDLSAFFTPSSRYLNTDMTCAYYSHQVQRQYSKGITGDMAARSLRLLNLIVPPIDRWDDNGKESKAIAKYGKWPAYFRSYLEPYPAFPVILGEVIEGRRLSGAFAKHFSLWNIREVNYPVLMRGTLRAGIVHRGKILLLEQHRPVSSFLSRVTGYEVAVLGKGEFREVA